MGDDPEDSKQVMMSISEEIIMLNDRVWDSAYAVLADLGNPPITLTSSIFFSIPLVPLRTVATPGTGTPCVGIYYSGLQPFQDKTPRHPPRQIPTVKNDHEILFDFLEEKRKLKSATLRGQDSQCYWSPVPDDPTDPK